MYVQHHHHHHHCHHHNQCSCGYCYDCGRYVGLRRYPPYVPQPWPYYPNYPTWIQGGNQMISSTPNDTNKYHSINTSCNHH